MRIIEVDDPIKIILAKQEVEQKLMDEWINDSSSSGFKLERMTAEMLIHVLENEL
jgi:hypothetical protein